MKLPIYLDCNATTPVDVRVSSAMLPYLSEEFGNASSASHEYGRRAKEAVDRARFQVADSIGAKSNEIIFTSGATESINLALTGVMEHHRQKRKHLVIAGAEHAATLETAQALEYRGYRLTILGVDDLGRIDIDALRSAISDETALVSLMHANNEVGTVTPISEIGKLCRDRGVLFHCDAAQTVGKLPIDVRTMNVDLLSLSGHKLYAAKGVGALYRRQTAMPMRLRSLIVGGDQEFSSRAGTLNVAGVVGLGKAVELAERERATEQPRLTKLSERLLGALSQRLDGVELNGDPKRRLAGNLNISFANVEAEALLVALPDIACSSGSACHSRLGEPSHVLSAMGLDQARIHGAIRFGLGRFTQTGHVDYAVERLVEAVTSLRKSTSAARS
jgi:cysteine desulfurase